ncbi:branched-chain amino acid ABC transporter permease [Halobaculum limi]|uniref:branched-chain amino acid ABC transporter permease n=1 Tax=Halobaculum limi TaxID=3031916 RepID=UPI003D80F534
MSAIGGVRESFTDLTRTEQGVVAFIGGLLGLLFIGLVTGGLGPTYFLYLLGLVGMYVLLSFGLNAQWGYTGLINFSVAAFFGLGAYGSALLTADNSPIAGGLNPLLGLVVGLALAAVVAVIIGIPTLRLRADYLAIASLGLAEVVRLVVLNEREYTNGSAGLRGIPGFFEGWPVLSTFPQAMPGLRIEIIPGSPIVLNQPFYQALLNVGLVFVFVGVTFLILQRAHRSPWGRVLRTIRGDEDLAEALGKNTYGFKMQSFVLGSVIMALAGVFYTHLNLFVSPGDFEPINTFYVWIAVILGGSGSNRGAMFGGFVVIAIREGTRFLNSVEFITLDIGPLRLLAVGALIILIMRFRPEGVLPPQRELIWPSAVDEADVPDHGDRQRPHAADGGDGS